jgi:hypothetical protein
MPEPITYKFEVNVLLLQENDVWIAQGLEYDITGHGEDVNSAIDNFGKTFLGQAIVDLSHGDKPLANVKKAPKFYWEKFREAKWHRDDKKQFEAVPDDVLPAFMISALASTMRIYM